MHLNSVPIGTEFRRCVKELVYCKIGQVYKEMQNLQNEVVGNFNVLLHFKMLWLSGQDKLSCG